MPRLNFVCQPANLGSAAAAAVGVALLLQPRAHITTLELLSLAPPSAAIRAHRYQCKLYVATLRRPRQHWCRIAFICYYSALTPAPCCCAILCSHASAICATSKELDIYSSGCNQRQSIRLALIFTLAISAELHIFAFFLLQTPSTSPRSLSPPPFTLLFSIIFLMFNFSLRARRCQLLLTPTLPSTRVGVSRHNHWPLFSTYSCLLLLFSMSSL